MLTLVEISNSAIPAHFRRYGQGNMRYYTDTNLNSALSLKLTDRWVFQAFVLVAANTIPPLPLFHQQELKTCGRTLSSATGSLVQLFLEWSLRANFLKTPAFDFSWCSLSFRSWMKTPDSNKGEERWGAGLGIPGLRVNVDVHQCHSWKCTATLYQ